MTVQKASASPAVPSTSSLAPKGRAVHALLACLAGQQPADVGLDNGQLVIDLPALLHGQGDATRAIERHRAGQAVPPAADWPAACSISKPALRTLEPKRGRPACPQHHPLNQAVIAQALYDLRNGQLRRCKLMGFGEAELDALKHPALISVLANANVSWCSVTVNREVLRRLLQQGAGRGEGNRHGRSHAQAGREHGDGQQLLWLDASGSSASP